MTLQTILSCVPGFGFDEHGYSEVSKKDDDFGQRMVNAWRSEYPTDKSYSDLGISTPDEYSKKVIQAIKPIPFNDTTSSQICSHLAALAKRSSAVYTHLTKQLGETNRTFLEEMLINGYF
jgi:hypothetical protein